MKDNFIKALNEIIEVHNKMGTRRFHKLEPHFPSLVSIMGETITIGFDNSDTKLCTRIIGNSVTFTIDKDQQFVYEQDSLYDELSVVYPHIVKFIITLSKMMRFAYNEYMEAKEEKYKKLINSAIERMNDRMMK